MNWPDDHIPTCTACGNESLGEENPPSGLCDECFAEAKALVISRDVKRPADWKQRVRDAECPPVRPALVAHIREQLERDAEAYANPAKARVVADRLINDGVLRERDQ